MATIAAAGGGAVIKKTTQQTRSIYRHLLRTVAFGVRHKKPVVKNLRRLLREDVRTCLASGRQVKDVFRDRSQSTFLLHLLALRCSDAAKARQDWRASDEEQNTKPSTADETPHSHRANSPVHRLMLNIASLGYHHLSPNTIVQPNLRSRRIGGSYSTSLRRTRQRMLQGGKAARAQNDGSEESTAQTVTSATIVPSLVVTGSRPRGPSPYTSSSLLNAVDHRRLWNGQKVNGNMSHASDGQKERLQAQVDQLAEKVLQLQSVAKTRPHDEKARSAYEEANAAYRNLKGSQKVLLRSQDQAQKVRSIHATVARRLASVVDRASSRLGSPFIGSNRFIRWSKGDWLEPN